MPSTSTTIFQRQLVQLHPVGFLYTTSDTEVTYFVKGKHCGQLYTTLHVYVDTLFSKVNAAVLKDADSMNYEMASWNGRSACKFGSLYTTHGNINGNDDGLAARRGQSTQEHDKWSSTCHHRRKSNQTADYFHLGVFLHFEIILSCFPMLYFAKVEVSYCWAEIKTSRRRKNP